VNPAQHQRIQSLQDDLLGIFDFHKTGKKLSFDAVDPATFQLKTTTEQPYWFLYTYVKAQSDDDVHDSSSYNLYLRCIYWENADTFYKNGVAIAGVKMVSDNDTSVPMDYTRFQRV